MPSQTIPRFADLRDDTWISDFALPAAFPYKPPFRIKRWRQKDRVQNLYITDFDHTSMMNKGAGTDYYVNIAGGNDTNDGLSMATALRTPVTAYNKSDVRTIYLMPGMYTRNYAINNLGPLAKSINIIGTSPGVMMTSFFEQAGTWVSDGGGMFHQARSSVQRAWDSTVLNSFGDATLMVKATSSANCAATPNSWWTDNVTVWIHRTDGTTPTVTNTYITMQSAGTGLTCLGGYNIYAENIDFWGQGSAGAGVLWAGNTGVDDVNQSATVTCVGCSFKYSESNGTGGLGNKAIFLVNCVCSSNALDGYNYHQNSNVSYYPTFVEINCQSYNQGILSASENNNATTAHDGCLGVRIGGTYHDTFGPVYIDVLGAQSVGLGCEVYRSTAISGSNNYCVSLSSAGTVIGNTMMWIADFNLHDPSSGSQATAAAYNVTAPGVLYHRATRTFMCPTIKAGSGVHGVNIMPW